MSDVSRVARQLREQERAAQNRRRAVRTFRDDLDGLSDAASPLFRSGPGTGGPPPSPIQLPVGQCITVTADTTVPDGGGFVTFDTILAELQAGFGISVPTSTLAAPWSAVTGATVQVLWTGVDFDSSWRGEDALFTVFRGESPLWTVAARESLLPVSVLDGVTPHMPFGKGDGLRLWVEQNSGSAQPCKVALSFGMQDPRQIVAREAVEAPDAYLVGSDTELGGTVSVDPSGVQVGDTLVAAVMLRRTSGQSTPASGPPGWTLAYWAYNVNNNTQRTYWEKVADAGDVSGPLVWSRDGASHMAVVVFGVAGPVTRHEHAVTSQGSVVTREYAVYNAASGPATIVNLMTHVTTLVSGDGNDLTSVSAGEGRAASGSWQTAAAGEVPGGEATQDGSATFQATRWVYVAS